MRFSWKSTGSRSTALILAMTFILAGTTPSSGRPLDTRRPAGGFLLIRNDQVEQNPSEQNTAEDSIASGEIKTKNPTGAMLRSLAVPGWGQLYNEQYIKTGLVLIAEGLLIGGAIVEHQRSQDDYSIYDDTTRADATRNDAYLRYFRRMDKRNTWLWYLAGAKFLSMVDAYVDAHLYRFDEGPFAVDVEAWPGARLEMCLVIRYKMW